MGRSGFWNMRAADGCRTRRIKHGKIADFAANTDNYSSGISNPGHRNG